MMIRHLLIGLLVCLVVTAAIFDPAPQGIAGGNDRKAGAGSEDKTDADKPSRPFGIEKRTPWTTSKFHGTPEPPLPYRAERVFPKIHFKNPTVLTNAPGTKRLFVAEQLGKVYSIPDDPAAGAADLFLDTEELVRRLKEQTKEDLVLEAVYGLTFHPQFVENRYCYLCYVVREKDAKGKQYPEGTRVSRLTVTRTDPPRCEPDSEQLVISWLQGGHNGGCLKFGRDGNLYISSGDGGNAFPPDGLNAGQDVTNLLSSILRIDVDHAPAGRAYAIPEDNPFVSLAGARGEIWAYGLRNPWKMSFDRQTGDLWVGDVGWELWELVYRVHKADNFGWSLFEGRQPVHAERQRGPTPIVPATIEIPHTDGVSVTGGFVYRGKKFPKLVGTYVFGDWETRRIWGATVNSKDVGERHEIMDPTVRVVDFAEDNDGELYLLDYDDGTIHTLAKNDVAPAEHPFPRRLSETGVFASVAAHRPAEGVLPFSINAEQWSDGAAAERFVAVPGTGAIQFYASPKSVPGSMFNRQIEAPKDTVLLKTLSLETVQKGVAARRRVETQAMHFDGRDWRGYTYEWNDDQTDAVLVEAPGKTRVLTVADPHSPGGRKQQTWRFASRTECLRCHNPWSENLLAFHIPQLNRDHDYGGTTDNQLRTLRHIGLVLESSGAAEGEKNSVKTPLPKSPGELPRYVNPLDPRSDVNERSRVYLHVNCAHCHRNGGGGSAYVHLPYNLPLPETKSLGTRPSQGTFGLHDAKIIAPGDPFRSVLYFRMAKLGPGHMPHLATSVVDVRGLELMHDWIRQLPPPSDASPPAGHEKRDAEQQAMIDRALEKELSEADRARRVDEVLADTSRAARLFRAVQRTDVPEALRASVVEAASRHGDAAVRDLFESLLPEERRIKRLGDAIRPAELLKLAGDAARGRELFQKAAGVQCRNCHKIGGEGTEVGPDLSQIGKKYDREKLLESILEPSKNIEPQYVTWLVETTAGKVYAGLLVRRDKTEVVLKDSKNEVLRFATADVEGAFPQQKSLMPELLLRDFTAQQVADLLAYLSLLK